MSKKRIIWFGHTPVMGTGFGVVSSNVLGGLARMYPDEYEIYCLGIGHPPYFHHNRGMHPYEILPIIGSEAESLAALCNDVKPDLVILNHDLWVTDFVFKTNLFDRRNFPLAFYQPIDGLTRSGGVPIAWRDTLMKQDFTITYAEWAKDAFLKTCPEITDRTLVIPHGVDADLYRPYQKDDKEDIVVGMVAMNQYRKDHPTFIRAMEKVIKEVPNARMYLHCAYNSTMGYDIRQLIDDYNLHGHVIDVMVGDAHVCDGVAVPLQDMPKIYNLMDIHVLSTTGEGFGLPHAEAMACGTPALATDYTTLHDLMPFEWQRVAVTDYRPLHVIPLQRAITDPDDMAGKIIDLCRKPKEERVKLGADCREFILQYEWRKVIPIWHAAIQAMIQQYHSGPVGGSPQIVRRTTPIASPKLDSHTINDKLSIVVLGHNQSHFTKRCLESLVQHTKSPYQIVFVDNGSTDDTPDIARTFPITYVRSDTNLGVAGGRNLGLKYADGGYICLLDNDIEVFDGWDLGLISKLKNDQSIGMVGAEGTYLTEDINQWDAFVHPAWPDGGVVEVDYVRGMCQMFRREILDTIGNIDDAMVWHEDSEFSHRIKLAGYKLLAVNTPLKHGDGTTAKTVRGKDFRARWHVDLRYMVEKHAYNNVAIIRSNTCGDDCPHSFCSTTKSTVRALRDWGFVVFTDEMDRNPYPPVSLSTNYQIDMNGTKFGMMFVENDRVSRQYVQSCDVDKILCVSQHIFGAFKDSGFDPGRLVRCDALGADTDVFHYGTADPGTNQPFRFLWVGAAQPRKGLDVLIKAFGMAFNDSDDVELVIKNGSYGQKDMVDYMISQSPLAGKIHHVWENMAAGQLADLYRSAAFDRGAYVHPHRCEGFGLTLLEAALCGCRVGMTGYGGPMDFLGCSAGLFNYEMQPSMFHNHPGEPYFLPDETPLWAEPDVECVARWMRYVYSHEAPISDLCNTADKLRHKYNLRATTGNLIDALYSVVPDQPATSEFAAAYWETGEESNYHGYSRNPVHHEQAELFTDLFNLSGKKVLDIGAGYGYLVESLRGMGVDAHGIDISSYAIDRSPVKEYMDKVDIVHGCIESQYDAIISIDTMEHVPLKYFHDVLRKVYSALRPGGIICIIPGTLEQSDMHIDKTHTIFRSAEWWQREFYSVFDRVDDTDWKTKMYDNLPFAAEWKWQPLVGMRKP